MVKREFYTTMFIVTTLVIGVEGSEQIHSRHIGVFTVTDGPEQFHLVGQDFGIRADHFLTPMVGPFRTCFTYAPGATIELGSRASAPIGQWIDRPDFPNRFNGTEYQPSSFPAT